jgi:hypothetical protein
MKSLKKWFDLGPYDDMEGYRYHWYNKHYEFSGTRVRFIAGDLSAMGQEENGGDPIVQFTLEYSPLQSDMESEFYLKDNQKAHYDIHIVNVVFWRWGIYLSVRGRVYA